MNAVYDVTGKHIAFQQPARGPDVMKQIQCCACGEQVDSGVAMWDPACPDRWCRDCADEMIVLEGKNPHDYDWGDLEHPDAERISAIEKEHGIEEEVQVPAPETTRMDL